MAQNTYKPTDKLMEYLDGAIDLTNDLTKKFKKINHPQIAKLVSEKIKKNLEKIQGINSDNGRSVN